MLTKEVMIMENLPLTTEKKDGKGTEKTYDAKKKALLYYNPKSGNGDFKNNLDLIIQKFQKAGHQVIPVRASDEINLNDVMKSIDEKEYRQIMVAGGDGTINICVNAMVKNDINLPLAIFPAGTANDFAGYLNLPKNIRGQINIALGECYTYSDVGVCNEKCFINVAALGNLVDVSQKTNPALKNVLGIFAYYLKGATEVVRLKALPVKLTTQDKIYREDMFFMVVMNGESAGGFKKLSSCSEINDGKLNVVLFRKMPIREFVPLFFSVISGNHEDNKNVLAFETDRLTIESEVEISTDVDGEHGEKLPLEFSVLNRRIKIFTKENNE